jgi:hypothetical protein
MDDDDDKSVVVLEMLDDNEDDESVSLVVDVNSVVDSLSVDVNVLDIVGVLVMSKIELVLVSSSVLLLRSSTSIVDVIKEASVGTD